MVDKREQADQQVRAPDEFSWANIVKLALRLVRNEPYQMSHIARRWGSYRHPNLKNAEVLWIEKKH